MGFLNPLLLLGLGAVSVPIVIHLLNRRRIQRVVWAAMRFLQTSIANNQRRLRLEDLILLALRCLLLVLVALALARPVWRPQGGAGGHSPATAILLLDNSYSMGLTDGVQTRFEKARQAAEQILDALPGGSASAIWLVSDTVRPLLAEPSRDLTLARKAVREARLSSRSTDFAPVLQQALASLDQHRSARKEIYLLTDGQALGWRHWDQLRKLLEPAKGQTRLHLVLVGEEEEHNLGISDLRATSSLASLDQPVRFEVQVANFGRQDIRDVRVSLHLNQEPASEEAILPELPAGGVRSLSLFAKLRTEGYHAVTARIASDRLAADDQRTIIVRARRELRLLLVDGDPGREPREAETFFLRHALVPVPASLADQHFVKARTIGPAELATSRFEDYDVVVLANVFDLPNSTVATLEQYLARGGGLVIFPGGNLNRAFYNEVLLGRYAFLPAAFEPAVGDASRQEQPMTLQEKDYEHPIVALWNDPAAGTLASANFYRYYPLTPAPWPEPRTALAGMPRVVLRYRDGTPALLERDWGLGRVVQFGSSADTAWNDLAVRPAYVPLLYRTLGAILQRQEEGLNLLAGQAFGYRVPADHLGSDITITPPAGGMISRDFGRVELVGAVPMVRYTQTDQAGSYEIQAREPVPLALRFAVQPDPSESSLLGLSAAQLGQLGALAELSRYPSSTPLRDRIEHAAVGTEFWGPLVWLALLVVAAETLLAQWVGRSR